MATAVGENFIKHYSPAVHAVALLRSLSKMRQSVQFCDIELMVGGDTYHAHRNVLAAASPYFSAMLGGYLSEGSKSTVTIHGIPSKVFRKLIDFIYTGEVEICVDDCQDLLAGADMLGIADIMEACCTFMKNSLHPSNAVGILLFADAHCCIELRDAAENFIHSQFVYVSEDQEFLDIPKEMLVQILHSENLHIESEIQVLQAAIRWIMQDIAKRRQLVFDVLAPVRLGVISQKETEAYIQSLPDLSLKVVIGKIAQDFKAERRSMTELRLSRVKPYLFQPRKCARKNIYVVGGFSRTVGGRWSDSQSLCRVEYFNSFNQTWKTAAPLKHARSGLGVAVLNGCIYAVGGESESLIFDNAESYDPVANRWTEIESLTVPRCGLGLCALGGCLYAIGGWVGSEIGDSIEKYDPKQGCWTLAGKMNTPRFAMGVVEYQGLVYIVGGFSELGSELTVSESYNPVTREWQSLASMILPRAYVGLAALNGYIYAVGGWNETRGALLSVERYSLDDDSWSMTANMSTARAGASVATIKGMLYVIGGRSSNDQYSAPSTLDSVECYDPDHDSWFDLGTAPTGRCEAGTAVL